MGYKNKYKFTIIEQITGGYTQKAIAGGAQTTTLSVSDGSTAELCSQNDRIYRNNTGNQEMLQSL